MRNTEQLLNKPMPKNFKSGFSPTGKDFIIDKYIGRAIWEKIRDKKTRYILMAEALDFFQKEVVRIYGSYYKWQQDWCRRNGFENQYEYKKWLVKNLGFETYDLYQKDLVQKRGFKDRSDYERKRIKKQGFKTTMEYLEHLAKKAGFKNYSERRKHWKQKRKEQLIATPLNSKGSQEANSLNMRYQETSSEVSQIADATSDNSNIMFNLRGQLQSCEKQ